MSSSAFTPSTNYANAATPSNEGLVNTGAQTFGGVKTFTGLINANSGINLGQGAVTALDSGTYVPTFTLVNATAGTAQQNNWIRVGNIVFVTGYISGITVTTNLVDTDINLTSLPVETTFSSAFKAQGAGKFGKDSRTLNEAASVNAISGTNNIRIRIESTGMSNGDTGCFCIYSFSYQIA